MATLSHEDDSDDSDGDKSDGNADGCNGDDFQYGNDVDDVNEQTCHLWRP